MPLVWDYDSNANRGLGLNLSKLATLDDLAAIDKIIAGATSSAQARYEKQQAAKAAAPKINPGAIWRGPGTGMGSGGLALGFPFQSGTASPYGTAAARAMHTGSAKLPVKRNASGRPQTGDWRDAINILDFTSQDPNLAIKMRSWGDAWLDIANSYGNTWADLDPQKKLDILSKVQSNYNAQYSKPSGGFGSFLKKVATHPAILSIGALAGGATLLGGAAGAGGVAGAGAGATGAASGIGTAGGVLGTAASQALPAAVAGGAGTIGTGMGAIGGISSSTPQFLASTAAGSTGLAGGAGLLGMSSVDIAKGVGKQVLQEAVKSGAGDKNVGILSDITDFVGENQQLFDIGSDILGSILHKKGTSTSKQDMAADAAMAQANRPPLATQNALFGTRMVDGVLTQDPTQRGAEFLSQLRGKTDMFSDALNNYNVEDMAEQELELMRRLQADEEQRRFNRLQDRLFGMGQLGTTGGAFLQREFEQALQQEDIERTLTAIRNARGEQDRLARLFGEFQQAERAFAEAGQPFMSLGANFAVGQGSNAVTASQWKFQAGQNADDVRNNFWQTLGTSIADAFV